MLRGRLGKRRWLDSPRGRTRRAGGTVSGWADGNLRERSLGALLRGRGGWGLRGRKGEPSGRERELGSSRDTPKSKKGPLEGTEVPGEAFLGSQRWWYV